MVGCIGCEQFVAGQFAEGQKRTEMIAVLSRIFETRSAEEWSDYLKPFDTCVATVRNVSEVIHDFGLGKGESVVVPKLSATPGRLGGVPPRLGEHNHDVLGQP